jgi:phosphoserine phosphatase
MSNASPPDIIWDFDGTILAFDSEQALLESLSVQPRQKLGWRKAVWGRLLAWGDRKGWLGRFFKRLYIRCLRGLPVEELDALAYHLALHISPSEREAIRRIAGRGHRIVIVSCGTGDLIERTLAEAELDLYDHVEANWFTFWQGRIENMDLAIHMAADKLAAIDRLGLDLNRAVAIGDGITDIPVLDRARWPILLDRHGEKGPLIVRKGYYEARSLIEVAELLEQHL